MITSNTLLGDREEEDDKPVNYVDDNDQRQTCNPILLPQYQTS